MKVSSVSVTSYEDALASWRKQLNEAFADPRRATSAIGWCSASPASRGSSAAERKERLRTLGARRQALGRAAEDRARAAGRGRAALLRGAGEREAGRHARAAAPSSRRRCEGSRDARRRRCSGLPGVGPATAQKLADARARHRRRRAAFSAASLGRSCASSCRSPRSSSGSSQVTRGTVDEGARRVRPRAAHPRRHVRRRRRRRARRALVPLSRRHAAALRRRRALPRLGRRARSQEARVEMIHPGDASLDEAARPRDAGRARALSRGRRRARAHRREAVPRGGRALRRRGARRHAARGRREARARRRRPRRCARCTCRRPSSPRRALRALNDGVSPPQRRLVFDEFFFLQLGLARRRGTRGAKRALALPAAEDAERDAASASSARCRSRRPARRERAIAEIARRSGASRIRCIACCRATSARARPWSRSPRASWRCASGFQAAIMAPTEILAEQHARTLAPWARGDRPLARAPDRVDAARRRASRSWRCSPPGKLDIVVGTHALLAERVAFARLGMVVIDEQHRFGVAQRALLRDKGGMLHAGARAAPHLLVMTATPIPRTLALTRVRRSRSHDPRRAAARPRAAGDARAARADRPHARAQRAARARSTPDARRIGSARSSRSRRSSSRPTSSSPTSPKRRLARGELATTSPMGVVHGRLPTAGARST